MYVDAVVVPVPKKMLYGKRMFWGGFKLLARA
jgi:hypothetical protein